MAPRVAAPPGLGRARALFVLALLAIQALLVQPHIHAAPLYSAAHVASGAPARSPHAQAECPICDELALFGHYAPPAPVSLPPAPTSVRWFQSGATVADAPASSSHFWRSRAPPSAFQA